MKKLILMATMLLTIGMANAQVKIYKGSSSSYSDIICNVNGNKVYKGSSSSYSDIICNVSGDKIYKGSSSSYSDILYNVKDGKIYKGSSSSYSDIVMNIKDGKIYKGSSSSYSDIIVNISNGKVYAGSSSSYSDISFNNSGSLTIEEFVAVWYAVKYSYWNEPKSRKYRNINGVIVTDDMITLSTSLNKTKRNEFKNFN